MNYQRRYETLLHHLKELAVIIGLDEMGMMNDVERKLRMSEWRDKLNLIASNWEE